MKLYRNIIIVVAVLAVLGGAMYFVSKYIPDNQSENTPSQESAEGSDMMNVYKANSEDVAKIRIKNTREEYALERSGENWVLNGDSGIRLSQTTVNSLVYTCTSISVKQAVAETDEKAADFGFSEPTGFAELHFKDGTVKKITVGNPSLDHQNYYVMLSDDPKIYLKNAYGTMSLIPESQTLRNLVLMDIDTSDLTAIHHFHMSRQGNTAVKLEYINIGTEEDPNMQWKMLEPVYAEVNGQVFVNNVLDKLESLEAASVVEDHAKNFASYGLDKPYATFSVGTTDGDYTMKIGGETGAYRYVMLNDSDTVYVLTKTNLAFLDTSYVDLMSNLIHVEYISDVDRVEVISEDQTYNMEIKGDEGSQTYFINGAQIEKVPFSRAYQAVIGISLESLSFDEVPSISPEAQIKYYKKDGSVVTVAFLPVDERNYRVMIDGRGNSITNKKNFEDVIKKLSDTVNQGN